jgi:hypothetical protein
MSNLSSIEKLRLETFLQMGGGYVLDFSNRSFREFVHGCVGVDIESEKYSQNGTSKANRLRVFWAIESNHLVSQLLASMIIYCKEKKRIDRIEISQPEQEQYDSCMLIVTRLKQDGTSIDIEPFNLRTDDNAWNKLSEKIKTSIEKNDPEGALDRLHTFMIHFFRDRNTKHKILFNESTPLNSLAGSYFGYLKTNGLIESEMGKKILKYGVLILEDFNDIRNNKSLSHANPILNHEESVLIFNYISSILKFLQTIE